MSAILNIIRSFFDLIRGYFDFILRVLGIKKLPEKPPVVTDEVVRNSPAPSIEREERQNRYEP